MGVNKLISTVRKVLAERYVNELSWLADYLRKKPISITDHWYDFVWLYDNYDLSNVADLLPKLTPDGSIDEIDRDEVDDEVACQIGDRLDDEQKQAMADRVARDDPSDAPSWVHMSFERVLPRQTWLIHKCSNNGSIRRNGFNKGVADVARLGLTTWYKDDSSMKSTGGYNFAFPISRHRSDLSKYGQHAVMFQSAAVEVWHHGDDEHQAIFWGPAVDRRSVICVDHDPYGGHEYGEDWVPHEWKVRRVA